MGIRTAVKRLLNNDFVSDEERVYAGLRDRGLSLGGIIDVGAYEGKWSQMARGIFGAVPTLMVEAQRQKEPFLRECSAGDDDWTYQIALLAAEEGREVTFYEMETGSSLMPERSDVARVERTLQTSTLDSLAARLDGADLFLKIDVQGAEMEVLKGATATLARCALVQLETAILTYNDGAPTMRELLAFMEERGFAPVDIAGQIRIKGRLIQIDMLFAPTDSPIRPTYFEWEAGDV